MKFACRREAMEFVRDNSQIVEVISTDPFTMVKVQCVVAGQSYESARFSKRNPTDKYNKQLGIDIAYGRAISDIARKFYQPTVVTGDLSAVELCMMDRLSQGHA